MRSGNTRQTMDMNKESDRHYDAENKSLFPLEVADDLRAAIKARGLSSEQASEEIGISTNVIIQICDGGTPKGARKVKAKVKVWLEAQKEGEANHTD